MGKRARALPWVAVALTFAVCLRLPALAGATVQAGKPTVIDSTLSSQLDFVSCPGPNECVAVDWSGRLVTFDPTASSTSTVTAIDLNSSADDTINAVACPSATQCTAVDADGFEVTFNPQSPSAAKSVSIQSTDSLNGVACPSATLCTVVGDNGKEISFNPQAISTTSPGQQLTLDGTDDLIAVSCDPAAECVAVDDAGYALPYSATTPSAPKPTKLTSDGSPLDAISCITGQCVAVAQITAGATDLDMAYAFAPTAPAGFTSGVIDSTPDTSPANSPDAIDCVSTTQCTMVNYAGGEATFTPGPTPATTVHAIDGTSILWGVDCPSSTSCVAVGASGNATIFLPSTGAVTAQNRVDTPGTPLDAVGCVSATVCVAGSDPEAHRAVGSGDGSAVIYNPANALPGTVQHLDADADITGVACLPAGDCTAVDDTGEETTFDPTAPGTPQAYSVDPKPLTSVACPTAGECVGVDSSGGAVAFSPSATAAPGTPTVTSIDPGGALNAVACPSATQCTAVDRTGHVITFTPGSSATPPSYAIFAGHQFTAITCPSTTQCTAVSPNDQYTFVPSIGAVTEHATIDSAASLQAIQCLSSTDCIAVDTAGDLLEGNPLTGTNWPNTAVSGANAFLSLTCPSSGSCTAVDAAGAATSIAVGAVNTAAPTITGTPQVGQVLTEAHGSWLNSPTSYAYQWQSCTTSGTSCTNIASATGQTYTVGTTLAGTTIRVTETAANAVGPGLPSTSKVTGTVTALPAPTVTAPTVTVAPTITGTPALAQTLATSTGTWSGTAPLTYAYQWQRCAPTCAPIAGATAASYTTAAADVGSKLAVTVVATNSAGSASSTSAQTATVTVPIATIDAALSGGLKPTGKLATIAKVLRVKGFMFTFSSPSAGALVIDWYVRPAAKKTKQKRGKGKAKQPAPELVGKVTITAVAGTNHVTLKLNAAGLRLLKHSQNSLKLTSKVSFTPAGGTATTKSGSFTLKK